MPSTYARGVIFSIVLGAAAIAGCGDDDESSEAEYDGPAVMEVSRRLNPEFTSEQHLDIADIYEDLCVNDPDGVVALWMEVADSDGIELILAGCPERVEQVMADAAEEDAESEREAAESFCAEMSEGVSIASILSDRRQ